MRGHIWVLLLLWGAATILTGASHAWADDKAEAKKIARLITDLGSNQFAERDQATRVLDKLGAPALAALQEACRSQDLEVRRRAEELVRTITRRLETARLLEPKRVQLVFKDTPVSEAVEILARTTGFTIQYEGDKRPIQDRKITLDTGNTTF